jgi:hypothetical protein
MKKSIIVSFCCLLFSSCSIYNHYSVDQLKSRYAKKMNNNRTDKFKEVASGKSFEIKRKELFEKTPIFFSESEITRPHTISSFSTWDYVNKRIVLFPLVLFSKGHILNQSLRKAALINASLKGDGAIVSVNPYQYQIVKFTDGKESTILNTSEVLDKASIKKAQKELEQKLKEEKKKFKKGVK